MFKCVFYVFVTVKCLITAVIICVGVPSFVRLCNYNNDSNYETERSDLLL